MPDASSRKSSENFDASTVESFGDEWSRFDQSSLSEAEAQAIFDRYFAIFPWAALPPDAQGFDMGCGTGRWAKMVAPRVGKLNCIDISADALAVARRNLASLDNVAFYNASVDAGSLPPASQDFGYSLGVLHHVPDTPAAVAACTKMLKPGAPFLVYLYYRFDNRPMWFRAIWRASEVFRALISRLPQGAKSVATDAIAALVYWPLSRLSRVLAALGAPVGALPLSYYRDSSFYTLRTDSRDRFGTPLEQRFTRDEIRQMMQAAGLVDIVISDGEPYWCAVGRRA